MSAAAELDKVTEALDWANAPVSDDALDGLNRRLGLPPSGYTPAGRVRALYSRERIEANQQRGRAEEAEAEVERLTRLFDRLRELL